jgi:membrane-associated phospholipid phosphatase
MATHTAPPESGKSTVRHELARLISIVVHPIILPMLTLGAVAYLAEGGAAGGEAAPYDAAAFAGATTLVAACAAITAVPVALLVWVQVLRGRWSDLDVSVRRQRYLLYPFGVVCMLATAGAFVALDAPPVAVRGALGMAAANAANGLINLRYKVSAHAAVAALCAGFLWLATPLADPTLLAAPVTAGAVLVGWSRVALGRHTVGQVVLGWTVGLATALAAAQAAWPLALPGGVSL